MRQNLDWGLRNADWGGQREEGIKFQHAADSGQLAAEFRYKVQGTRCRED